MAAIRVVLVLFLGALCCHSFVLRKRESDDDAIEARGSVDAQVEHRRLRRAPNIRSEMSHKGPRYDYFGKGMVPAGKEGYYGPGQSPNGGQKWDQSLYGPYGPGSWPKNRPLPSAANPAWARGMNNEWVHYSKDQWDRSQRRACGYADCRPEFLRFG
ncbi:hypothetical protein AAVH_14044 [Aphelenchoides avenae]|nr:hypothetical protein AAVH_14044 [Aphelenchus avenae]